MLITLYTLCSLIYNLTKILYGDYIQVLDLDYSYPNGVKSTKFPSKHTGVKI